MSQSLFYTSPITVSSKPPRGGVPVLFPQFADRGPLKKHGYARDHKFHTVKHTLNDGVASCITELYVPLGTWPSWPYSALITLHQTTYPGGAEFALVIDNIGNDPFNWTGGLHPYFSVGDITQIQLFGLNKVSKILKSGTSVKYGERGEIVFDSNEFETLFLAPAELHIADPVAGRNLKLECFGFHEWMVWNPGAHMCKRLGDLPADDWKNFLCIEPVAAHSEIRLQQGQVFTGGFKVSMNKI